MADYYYTLDNIDELRGAILDTDEYLMLLRKDRKSAKNKFDKTSQEYDNRGRPDLKDNFEREKSELTAANVAYEEQEKELTYLESKLDSLESIPEGPITMDLTKVDQVMGGYRAADSESGEEEELVDKPEDKPEIKPEVKPEVKLEFKREEKKGLFVPEISITRPNGDPEDLFNPETEREGSELEESDNKLCFEAYRAGVGKKVITRRGPLNARIYRLQSPWQVSGFSEDSVPSITECRPYKYGRKENPMIQGVAWLTHNYANPLDLLIPPESLPKDAAARIEEKKNRKIEAIRKPGPKIDIIIKIKWQKDGKKSWESRSKLQSMWGVDTANRLIYKSAVEAEARYMLWKDGDRPGNKNSPSPFADQPDNTRFSTLSPSPSSRSPSPAPWSSSRHLAPPGVGLAARPKDIAIDIKEEPEEIDFNAIIAKLEKQKREKQLEDVR